MILIFIQKPNIKRKLRFEIPLEKLLQNTVNVDIFACINFRGFINMANFACIKIRVLSAPDSLGYYTT